MRSLVCLTVCALSALAQAPVREPEQIALLESILQGQVKTDSLSCEVDTSRPFLDFAFRFEAGYVVRCPLAQFQGRGAAIAAYLRVQIDGGKPIYLGEGFHLPELPTIMRADYVWKRFHQQAEFSGVFATGLGRYPVDLVVVDDRQRIYHKAWVVKVSAGRSERKAEIAMLPNTVAPAGMPPWHNTPERVPADRSAEDSKPQITVLLDAAPIYPAAQKLRAWDRAFLLGSLTSLLRGMQASSVRLIAFNLDQQREVFHEETFSREHFPKLGEALRNLELGTVSYRTLQAQGGWADLLTGLVRNEARGNRPPDAVIFLGPNVRNLARIPRELLTSCDNLNTRVFYLEFFPVPGAEFPDTIHQLTNSCHGNIYKLHSPADLAEAITKLQAHLPAQP